MKNRGEKKHSKLLTRWEVQNIFWPGEIWLKLIDPVRFSNSNPEYFRYNTVESLFQNYVAVKFLCEFFNPVSNKTATGSLTQGVSLYRSYSIWAQLTFFMMSMRTSSLKSSHIASVRFQDIWPLFLSTFSIVFVYMLTIDYYAHPVICWRNIWTVYLLSHINRPEKKGALNVSDAPPLAFYASNRKTFVLITIHFDATKKYFTRQVDATRKYPYLQAW